MLIWTQQQNKLRYILVQNLPGFILLVNPAMIGPFKQTGERWAQTSSICMQS